MSIDVDFNSENRVHMLKKDQNVVFVDIVAES